MDTPEIAFALCITSDSAREIAGAREYLSQTPYKVLDGEIPFRAAFKTAMDQGKALTETSFPTLRKKAEPWRKTSLMRLRLRLKGGSSDG